MLQRLIRAKSLSGEEQNVVGEIKSIMTEAGFDKIETDKYGSVIGTIAGNREGKTILFDAHIDTVPVSDAEEWQHDPFAAEEADGKIYGRGTSDMKGALAAMLYAGSVLAQKRDFAGKFLVSGVVHEECFEGIAAREISRVYKPDYVVIGEASELRINIGQRGRAEVVVETYGKCAHSSNPQAGVNAVLSMLKLCGEIDKLPLVCHERLGNGILALTDIISSPYPGASVIPNKCRATYDRRTVVGETPESVLAPIKGIIEKLSAEDESFSASVYIAHGQETCYTGEIISGERLFPSWLMDEDSDFVRAAAAGVEKYGIKPVLGSYSFCTNGSHYAGEAGIQTIGFGPSRENLAHVKDEYIEIESLENAAKGYIGIVEEVLK
ncbi:MAG: YgeY family selenium metabolism-linked hydrolase [Oscillospiraceae bacterium]